MSTTATSANSIWRKDDTRQRVPSAAVETLLPSHDRGSWRWSGVDIVSSRQWRDFEIGRAFPGTKRDKRSFIINAPPVHVCEEAAASRTRTTDMESWCLPCVITERFRERSPAERQPMAEGSNHDHASTNRTKIRQYSDPIGSGLSRRRHALCVSSIGPTS